MRWDIQRGKNLIKFQHALKQGKGGYFCNDSDCLGLEILQQAGGQNFFF